MGGVQFLSWYPITPSSSLAESVIDYGSRYRLDPDTGADVTALQTKLGIDASGTFDAVTEAAVRRFQSDNGLVADGIVGPQTWGRAESKVLSINFGFFLYEGAIAHPTMREDQNSVWTFEPAAVFGTGELFGTNHPAITIPRC